MDLVKKINCWEFHNCGKEPGGKLASKLGVCPASIEKKLDGIHGGINGGRACWAVTGTYCGGKVQGKLAQKINTCSICLFYKTVLKEDFQQFVINKVLIEKVNK